MQEILINPELLELVKQEKKVTTCRKGMRDYSLGETILKSNQTEDFVHIDIIGITYRPFESITDSVAMADGFKNKNNLKEVLEEIYGEIDNDETITIVNFRLLGGGIK